MLTEDKIQAYLDRIGYRGDRNPDLNNLTALMRAHLTHIPFETVRLHRSGVIPDLDLSTLYLHIVVKKLGGYCFELNKLFQALLQSLGYNVRAVISRSTDTPGVVDPFNHRGLIVSFDDCLYSADVGYGGPMPIEPLLLESGTYELSGKTFIVEDTDRGYWIIDRIDSKGNRQGLLELMKCYVNEQDFKPLNLYCATPGSFFRDSELANICTEDGTIALTDGLLKIRSGENVSEEQLNEADVDEALRKHFGFTYESDKNSQGQ